MPSALKGTSMPCTILFLVDIVHAERRSLYGRIAPAVAINAPARVDRSQEALHLGRLPPVDARQEEVGEENALRGQRRDLRLQACRVHVVAHPRSERLDRLAMPLYRLEPKRVVGGKRIQNCAGGQSREAHVLIDAHRMGVATQHSKPEHCHDVALHTKRAMGRGGLLRAAMLSTRGCCALAGGGAPCEFERCAPCAGSRANNPAGHRTAAGAAWLGLPAETLRGRACPQIAGGA
eukprot:2609564-Prymnesium_polylepis.1